MLLLALYGRSHEQVEHSVPTVRYPEKMIHEKCLHEMIVVMIINRLNGIKSDLIIPEDTGAELFSNYSLNYSMI